MRLTFVQLSPFADKWRKLGLTDDDLAALESILLADPEAGSVMAGTNGLRKVRFAPPSWRTGKSGATRVCYVHIAVADVIYFVTFFAKSEKANLTAAERNKMRALLVRIRARHAK